KQDGNPAPLEAALKNMPPDFNPGGSVTTVAVRVALMHSDPDEAPKLLGSAGLTELNDGGIGGIANAIDGYTFPRTWYEAWIARQRGDTDAATRAFEAARLTVEHDARICSSDDKSLCILGLIDAGLGRKKDAIA